MKRCVVPSICLPLLLSASLWLVACSSAPPLPSDRLQQLFDDAAFAPPAAPIDPGAVFALSDEMAQAVAHREAGRPATDARQRLLALLLGSNGLVLEYESTRTRTAAEAYQARAGNCLSLVIMTAAFAKAMGVPVRFQSVIVDERWSRSGDLYVASGHVNLTLGRPGSRARSSGDVASEMVIDFLPSAELQGQRSRALEEKTVVAMFMNNRAAEALAGGAVDDAYWWVRQALQHDARLPAAYNTLGVVYLRRGLAQQAQAALDEALRLEPDNTRALANLVQALQRLGRTEAAASAAARLSQLEPTPPFHWFNAGLQAMREHDYRKARELFARELDREPDYHEFHFWLAQAEARLGNLAQARRHLELAAQTSTTEHDHALYAGKLDRLRALSGPQPSN